jgi:uncharacterized phage-associated protein
MQDFYVRYHSEQLDKIGNTLIYLANHIQDLSKTKALKLLYILDELAVRKSGIPFLNLKYEVWKFGPVAEDIFIDLSNTPSLLKKYIKSSTHIQALKAFNDDEFTQNDLTLLDLVVRDFGTKTAKELVKYTHRPKSLWYELAKENNVLDLLEQGKINSTKLVIDLGNLVAHDAVKKELYQDYIAYN